MKLFHTVLGIVLTVVYFYVLIHLDTVFPDVAKANEAATGASSATRRAGEGMFYVFVTPLFAIACFLFPNIVADVLSPKSGFFKKPVFGAGFWYLVGYFTLVVSYALFHLF